jgi:uncharacterized protein YjiS (DUF1127 family)
LPAIIKNIDTERQYNSFFLLRPPSQIPQREEHPTMAILDILHPHTLRHTGRPYLAVPSLPSLLSSLAAMLRAVQTRRQLAQMDDRMLRDIGISRADALMEAGRAPWDLGCRR